MLSGADRIAQERARQIGQEGFTPQHDTDANPAGELAWAAVCYAAPEAVLRVLHVDHGVGFQDPWPASWARSWDKRVPRSEPYTQMADGPTETETRIRELEKAGALIAAEIDRLTGEGP